MGADAAEALSEEIIAQAKREAQKMVEEAREAARTLLREAQHNAQRERERRVEGAKAEGERRREMILATVAVEVGRLRSERVEQLLESVHEEICQRLQGREGFDYRAVLVGLAREAISQMVGNAFVIRISSRDRDLAGEYFAREVEQRVGRPGLTLVIEQEQWGDEAGVIVQDMEKRQIWDNRLRARLARLWPELRGEIGATAGLVPEGGDRTKK